MAEGTFIAYYRVSTAQQGKSGLGLEAQQSAVKNYLNGGTWKLLAEFTEVESGTSKRRRPELEKALELCKVFGAKLIIAKLDRLARNVAFVSNLMEAGVDFVAVDFPQANRFTIHIMAAVAEHEAKLISDRTKAALAAAKERGVKLGNPRWKETLPFHRTGHKQGGESMRAKTLRRDESLRKIIEDIRSQNVTSHHGIAKALNALNVPTARGRKWHASSAKRLLFRLQISEQAAS